MRNAVILASLAAMIAATPAAAQRCSLYSIPLSAKLRQSEAARVSATGQRTQPGQIKLVYEERGWRLVWAVPDNAERGVFFFRKDGGGAFRYVDVWGGVLSPDEFGSATSWALKLPGGIPRRLAQCFESAVMRGF